MEVHMGADMEVDKVADMVAKMFADIVAKKGTQFGKKKKDTKFCKKKKKDTGACKKEEEEKLPNLVRELVNFFYLSPDEASVSLATQYIYTNQLG